MSRTFPKEGQKKLNATIKQLRDQIKAKDKLIFQLSQEIQNLTKPVRVRKEPPKKQTHEEWLKDFCKRVKEKT